MMTSQNKHDLKQNEIKIKLKSTGLVLDPTGKQLGKLCYLSSHTLTVQLVQVCWSYQVLLSNRFTYTCDYIEYSFRVIIGD